MDGESATGRIGKKYFYYRCNNQECGMRVAAHEVEEAIADKLVMELVSLEGQPSQDLLRDKLNELGQRRSDLEHGLAKVRQEMDSLNREVVDADLVRATLGQIKGLFEALKPYEQRELMQLVLQRAEVNEREITLEVYALTEAALPGKVGADGDVVRTRPDWLPRRGAVQRYSYL